MVLSAALDKGYIFLSFVAILTSVIGAVYYLSIIKEIFFYESPYKLNPLVKNLNLSGNVYNINSKEIGYNIHGLTYSLCAPTITGFPRPL